MDETQMIIHNVDVSKCMFFNKNYKEDNVQIKNFCELQYISCKEFDCANCYFKKWKRKEQELKNICKAFDIEYAIDEETGNLIGRCNKLYKKEQECEQLRNKLNSNIEKMNEQNEKLHNEIQTIRQQMKTILMVSNNGKYRPVKNSTKEQCYQVLGNIQELLGTNIIRLSEVNKWN